MGKRKPIGVTMAWRGEVVLCFDGGTILGCRADRILYPEYFPNKCEWPIDPETGEKLKIAEA